MNIDARSKYLTGILLYALQQILSFLESVYCFSVFCDPHGTLVTTFIYSKLINGGPQTLMPNKNQRSKLEPLRTTSNFVDDTSPNQPHMEWRIYVEIETRSVSFIVSEKNIL